MRTTDPNLIVQTGLELADVLRGRMSRAETEGYVFRLLTMKWFAARAGESGSLEQGPWDAVAGNAAPAAAAWQAITTTDRGIGEALNDLAASIEQVQPALRGVLTSLSFTDESRFGSDDERDRMLARAITTADALALAASVPRPDSGLSIAFDLLFDEFSSMRGKSSGATTTPSSLRNLLIVLAAPKAGDSFFDPACGVGSLLGEAARSVYPKMTRADFRTLGYAGQEIDPERWALCSLSMAVRGIDPTGIRLGDTLREPKHVEGRDLKQHDVVASNLPLMMRNWFDDEQLDHFRRFSYGRPPRTQGQWALIQHGLAALAPRGRACFLVPTGVLFRRGIEQKIRRGVLEDDRLETVVLLPSKLLFETSISLAILLFNNHKPEKRRGRFLFIDAAGDVESHRFQNRIPDAAARRIIEASQAFEDLTGYCRMVDLTELRPNEYVLDPSRYVGKPAAEESLDVRAALFRLAQLEEERDRSAAEMDQLLADLGYLREE